MNLQYTYLSLIVSKTIATFWFSPLTVVAQIDLKKKKNNLKRKPAPFVETEGIFFSLLNSNSVPNPNPAKCLSFCWIETLAQIKLHLSFELLERPKAWQEMTVTSGFKTTEHAHEPLKPLRAPF